MASARHHKVALDHQLFEENGGLSFNWDVAESALDLNAVETAFQRYVQTVETLSDHPDHWQKPVGRYLPDNQAETRRRLHRDGDYSAAAHEDLCAAFWDNLPATAQNIALLWSGGAMTYGALARRAADLATRLIQAGAKPADRVAIRLDKGRYRSFPFWPSTISAQSMFLSLPICRTPGSCRCWSTCRPPLKSLQRVRRSLKMSLITGRS